mmetsp:Transcript_60658/g.130207  ORF Transcript_60658/g.130207 Transcript_60658/m.130207 type:complete len:263 (+) Transcript_60658:560-1348(+)
MLIEVIVLFVVPHIKVHLGAQHEVGNLVLIQLGPQDHLRGSEAAGRHDEDLVEVAQAHVLYIGLIGHLFRPRSWQIPELHPGLAGEGVRRGPRRGLVDANRGPTRRMRPHPADLVDQKRLADTGIAHDADVDRALYILQPVRWWVVEPRLLPLAQSLLLRLQGSLSFSELGLPAGELLPHLSQAVPLRIKTLLHIHERSGQFSKALSLLRRDSRRRVRRQCLLALREAIRQGLLEHVLLWRLSQLSQPFLSLRCIEAQGCQV